ncbi:hypothetical protein [Photobacterium lipolyticum]|uniref:Uncharacterized protein n=1 Tax=Photobacterium lipolyticum TaxID=266810 RepID=A0A2T3N2F2_9GAMM|nr:hypothetical protein [Photobacterium lipolyticum]PSW06518.1 hypothetical protein C9I89_03000 [Photobacterium lipolyticum]
MKKAVALFALLALVGCDEDDVKDILQGKTTVFAVSDVTVNGSGSVPVGNYKVSEITPELQSLIPEGFPDGTEADLDNAGIGTDGTSCGQIVVADELCFEKDNPNSCVPSDVTKLGLAVYKIDLSDIKTAANLDFYPTLAAELGGLFVQIEYEDINCSALN